VRSHAEARRVYRMRFLRDLEVLGLRRRRVRDLGRTGISLAIADGADENILRTGTHQPPKHIMGLYTAVARQTLCREVSKMRLEHNPFPDGTIPVGAPRSFMTLE